jgi:hypothetical protein
MRTLKESILSDIEDTLVRGDKDADYIAVMEIINRDYRLYKVYKSSVSVVGKAKSGKILIDGKGKIEFTNKSAKSVVNDIFEWNEFEGEFNCFKCNIESLEGFPRKIYNKEYKGCGINIDKCENLKTLKGCPNTVFGSFYCRRCMSLTTLEGAPEKIIGNFDCRYCDSLKSLKGAPKYIAGDFNCADCRSLESLEGAPDKVPSDFDCGYCRSLKSLKGLPSSIGRCLYLPKIDELFDETGAEIISKTSVKRRAYVIPIKD